jgi:hypothetical protein
MGFGLINELEQRLRHLLQRVGGLLDFALRRRGLPQTEITALLPRIESVIETQLREEAGRLISPDLIELRYDFETWTAMGEKQRGQLEVDLAQSLFEFTVNRRYRLKRPLSVKIGYDAFTRGVEIRCGFGDELPAPPLPPAPQPAVGMGGEVLRIVLVEQRTGVRHRVELEAGGAPVGIGRNIANALVIRDATISNFHAALRRRTDGVIEIADRGGANGTAVNGVPLVTAGRSTIGDGDLVRLGGIECRLMLE